MAHQDEALARKLLNVRDVDQIIDELIPDWGVQTVPYSNEDGQPRVVLNYLGSYCSLNLPLTGGDILYHATLLVVFGRKQ
jgi:hypothetical protein